jgi:hypothetical protein
VLAQLQLGKVQLLALQEYPAASLLDIGRVILPSWASTPGNSKAESNQVDRMVEYSSNMGGHCTDKSGLKGGRYFQRRMWAKVQRDWERTRLTDLSQCWNTLKRDHTRMI